MSEIETQIETQSIQLLNLMYDATPTNILASWGISRYNRFKTKCWKHLEETASLAQFINTYFKYFDASLVNILTWLSENDSHEIFTYLNENITILVGRLQAQKRKDNDCQLPYQVQPRRNGTDAPLNGAGFRA